MKSTPGWEVLNLDVKITIKMRHKNFTYHYANQLQPNGVI